MRPHLALCGLVSASIVLTAASASAQPTPFYLHNEGSPFLLLKTAGPDVPTIVFQTADLKNQGSQDVAMRIFQTPANVPGWYGTIPAQSTISFRFWMRKTSLFGVVYPRATLRLASGAEFCQATGTTAVSATSTALAPYDFSCSTSTAISVQPSDQLWVAAGYYMQTGPGNKSMKVELDIEGLGSPTVTDSRVTIPNPITPIPTISSLNYPSAAPTLWVTITGTNFGTAGLTRSVTFNNTAVAAQNWQTNPERVDAQVPAGQAAGTVAVRVVVQGAQSDPMNLIIVPAPTLTSLTPSTGHTTDVVTIAGANFLTTQTQGSSTVTFNGHPATATSWSDTSLQVTAPVDATGPVVVQVAGRNSPSLPFTWIPPPTVAALYPTSGQVGTSVTIVGERFGSTQGTNTVTFNTVTATTTLWSDTVIKATVPAGVNGGCWPVVVKVSQQPSDPLPCPTFTVLVAGTMTGSITRVTGGTAISGASIQAVLRGVVKGTATTAADGSYTISGLDPGDYDVRVFKSGFSPELRTGQTVTATNTTTVNVQMYIPGSATGKVTQIDGVTPLVGAAVTAYDGPMQKGTTNTNATGDYTIGNLHPGSFTIQAANVGYRTSEQSAPIAENTATTTNFSLDGAPSGPVLYAYDELGRLVQVTDPSGESAIYRYDPVGNITAIERPGANVIAISDFTPNSGPEGAIVTIYGAGFSATPSQNIVTFNGTTATVTSATATQIVTTVPQNASTGPLTVQVDAVVGTSSPVSFAVANVMTPTIISFTPTEAMPGTALTVNGTNFDTTAINDNVRVNTSPALVSSATTTAIQTAVPPSAMTGRISVQTLNGSATSTGYLWVPPPTYTLLDFAENQTLVVPFGTHDVSAPAGKISVRAFDGVEGHRLAVGITADGNATSSVAVKLYGPFGALLSSAVVQTAGFLDTLTLRWTGTYSLVFDPFVATDARSGALTIYDVPADLTGSLAFAAETPITICDNLCIGQNARYTFTGTAGHRLSLDQAGFNCATSSTSILAPNGSTVTTGCGGTFLDATTPLTATGTYTVLVDPKDANTGSTTLKLYDVPADLTGTLTINDPATPVEICETCAGQNASFTFSGSNQQQIRATLSGGIAGTFPCVTMSLLKPDGQGGFISLTQNSGCGGFDFTYTLPAADTYTLKIDPKDNSTGSATVRVISPP